MCVQIVRNKETVPFDPTALLEEQVRGSKQVLINFNQKDSTINSFMEQFERIIKNGISCQMNIKFVSNNTLDSYRTERKVDRFGKELEINQLVETMVGIYSKADRELSELSQMCERAT